jgi:hypothetical protein
MGKIELFGILLLFAMVAPAAAFAGTSGPSPVPPAPNFQITTTTLTVCRGITNVVPLTISNLGNSDNPTMQSVQLSLNSRDIIELGNTIQIANITPDTSTIVNISSFIDLNASSLITVQIPINYDYLTLYSDSEMRNLTFQVQSCPTLIPLMVNVSPSVLISGQINNLTFSFSNTGNTILNYISASASIKGSQNGVVFIGRQPIQIASIAPKQTVNVTEGIYENSSQIFPLNVSTSFFNGTNLEEIADSFAMLSGGTTQMVPSSITVSPTNLTAGSIFSVSFIVTDIGTSGVSDASASAVLPAGFREYGTAGPSFIGSIQTQSPTAISLTLIANSTVKNGNYIIPVKISYLNSLRQNLSTTVNVPLTIGKSLGGIGAFGSTNSIATARFAGERGIFGYIIYIEIGLVALVIAVVVLSVLFVKERKKTHPKNPEHPKQKPK